MRLGRRAVLAGALAALAGAQAWRVSRGPALTLEPHPRVEGFRVATAGGVSAGATAPFDPLLGLSGPPDPAREARREAARAAVRADPAGALFGGAAPGPAVPAASFSDYACPHCRVLTARLAAMQAEGALRVAWHELPILGEGSRDAARAALAAGRQGAYPAMHARLMGTRSLPTPAFLREVAREIGLDAERLLADMASPAIDAALERSRALAAVFGFPGTPALVVGRTVVLGAVGRAPLERVVALERAGASAAARHPTSPHRRAPGRA